MARLREDEARKLGDLLGPRRLAQLGPQWEQKVGALEVFIALASWRSQGVSKRAAALVDALNAGAGRESAPVEQRWEHRDV